jgi:hypothetical protein
MRQPPSPSSRSEATTTDGTDRSAGTCTDDVALRTRRPAVAVWVAGWPFQVRYASRRWRMEWISTWCLASSMW